jgi:transcriptional regulator with XRE-family HTH domain
MKEIIGSRIKDRREALNMTQEQLVEVSGVSRGTISALENGKSENVTIGTLLAISKALDTTVDNFFA